LRFDDFTRATRSHTLTDPTAETDVLLAAVRSLLAAAMPMVRARGITLIGITFTNLADARAVQLVLPLGAQRPAALDAALDRVRDRYGAEAITRAALVGRDPGVAVPLLPD
jgi:DNA polymerase-4